MSINNKKVDAWLCKIGGLNFALQSARVQMIVEEPHSIKVLGAPKQYESLLLLQDKFYPIVNFQNILNKELIHDVAVLVPYKDSHTDQIQSGVIEFDSIPERIQVSDDMVIPMSELADEVAGYSLIAFEYLGEKVGVIDVDKVFNL